MNDTPAILVYLGSLNAEEMIDQGSTFHSVREWNEVVLTYARGVMPCDGWVTRVGTREAPMRALIRAFDLRWEAHLIQNGGDQ